MNIQFNGTKRQLALGSTLKQLIETEGLSEKRLAAEVNLEIIPKSEHINCVLNEGDTVEIVHAIGGG
ncbi:hypothetical protein MNBD_GAMMA07-335 [hydrothermal vent metagenome]|uniref:Sulfur carrier protein ThiS n=1 Tax=hydrothermal vent metagenome TaxID=652676 RepID=A0A3B0XKA2_9ZZZZ